jgi:hypothetical protein
MGPTAARRFVLFSALFVGACGPAGVDAELDCDGQKLWLHCNQGRQATDVSGWIGTETAGWTCNSPPQGAWVSAHFDHPAVGQGAQPGTTQSEIVVLSTCDRVFDMPNSSEGVVTVTQFQAGSHMTGSFEGALGRLHGTFDLECGDGNLFCAPVEAP